MARKLVHANEDRDMSIRPGSLAPRSCPFTGDLCHLETCQLAMSNKLCLMRLFVTAACQLHLVRLSPPKRKAVKPPPARWSRSRGLVIHQQD